MQAVDDVLGDDHEQGQVDGVDAFAEDGPLPAALAAPADSSSPARPGRRGLLEVVAVDDAAQRLAGRQRFAVAGVDVADLALRNGDQRHLVDAVLPAPQPEVQAAAQQVGLEAGLAVQGDDPAFRHRAAARPQLLDDADAVVGDVAHAQHHLDQEDDPQRRAQHPGDQGGERIEAGGGGERQPQQYCSGRDHNGTP